MWDPGHWNASGLQVLVSATETTHQYLPQSRVCFFFFKPPSLTALAVLVAAVPAVVGSVTHPALGDAAVVEAFKLSVRAELICRRMKGGHELQTPTSKTI